MECDPVPQTDANAEPKTEEEKKEEEEPFDAEAFKKACDKKMPLLKQQLAWAKESFDCDNDRTQKVKSEEKNWRELKSYNKDPPIEWVLTFELVLIILGKPEHEHTDWSCHRTYVGNAEDFLNQMTSYTYDRCTPEIFNLVKEKIEVFEGGFDARKQFNKKWPTAPMAQWVKEWFTAAESKVQIEQLEKQIVELETEMKEKLGI